MDNPNLRTPRFIFLLAICLLSSRAEAQEPDINLPITLVPQRPYDSLWKNALPHGMSKSLAPPLALTPLIPVAARPSQPEKARPFPTQWLLGNAITRDDTLAPLTASERIHLYWSGTYLNSPSYLKRLFSAGIDQARGVPQEWHGGLRGYGSRFASNYGQFIVQNSLQSVGNAALGYEPRYDLCRCKGFWRRTRHAILRNFVTYNSTETELRLQIPLYGATFAAGAISAQWKPGPRNSWAEGGYAAAQQIGWGALSNFLSEFSQDIGKKISRAPNSVRH
jgi:hypothetical protein